MLCLIYTHSPSGTQCPSPSAYISGKAAPEGECVYIRQSTLACVITYTCTILHGRVKVNHFPGPPWLRNSTLTRKHLITKLKFRFNIINKFKPTINSGFPIRIHLVTKFKFIDSILLTNSNPQSTVVLLCLYTEWHHFPGYKLFVSLFSGIHHICIPAFPFDPPMQSGTYICIMCSFDLQKNCGLYRLSLHAMYTANSLSLNRLDSYCTLGNIQW